MTIERNTWFIYAVAAGLLWGLWGVIAKFISEDINPFMNHFLFTIGMLFTLPLVLRKSIRSGFSAKGFLWGGLAACFAIAGNIAVFYAFSKDGLASIVIPITNLYPLVTIVIAISLFKEKLNIINVFGILLSVPAILLLSGETLLFTDPSAFINRIGLNEWFLYSVAAIFCWGIFSALQKITTNHISAEGSYTAFVSTSVVITIFFLLSGKINFSLSGKNIGFGAVAGIVNGLGVLASFAAYRAEGKAAAVTTVAGALQPVFTIVLAILFLNEAISGLELLGIILAIGAASLLSYEQKKEFVVTV